MQESTEKQVTFLIIRFSSIGDIVLTSPVVRCLKNQVENARIIYLTKPSFQAVLEHNPYIDKLVLLKNNINETLEELKSYEPDYIIDLHNNLRSRRVTFALRKIAFKVDKLNIRKWLLVNLKYNRMPKLHIVDRYMQTISIFDVENDKQGLDYFLPKTLPSLDFPEHCRINKYVALVVGAKHVTKQLPIEKLNELIQKIPYPVVLLGGKEDVEKASQLKIDPLKDHSAVGLLSLHQSAQAIAESAIVITHDTGLMHIASAFKKPVISIWGNTVPEFGMYPYYPGEGSAIYEVQGLSCRPCSKIGYAACPKKHFNCMNMQALDKIVAHTKAIFA